MARLFRHPFICIHFTLLLSYHLTFAAHLLGFYVHYICIYVYVCVNVTFPGIRNSWCALIATFFFAMHRRTRFLSSVHAFVRAPHFRSIPNTGPTGIVVNRTILNAQFREFYRALQHSTLVDKVHLMSERPGMDTLRVADHMTSVGPTLLSMPLHGMEHRATEFMEAMRYVRGAGGPSTAASYLQDNEACRCHSGDIVPLPHGIAVAHGSRTNSVAHKILQDLFEVTDELMRFQVITLEQEADAPPLGDYFGFAGNDVLLAWKDEHGLLAVDQYQQHNTSSVEMKVVYLEPGCHFLTFYGVDYSPDVLVQKGYERSMDSIAAAGLNPVSVQWTEMDKLDISMRSTVLPLKFFATGSTGVLTRRGDSTTRWQNRQVKN